MKPEYSLQNLSVALELLNAIPHGIAILDTNLCITAMNRSLECLTGYSAEEAKGIYGDFIIRTNLSNQDLVCRTVLRDGQSISKGGNIIGKDRKKTPIHFTISRLHDPDDSPNGILLFLENVFVSESERGSLLDSNEALGILGRSRLMDEVFKLMPVLARTDASVLITGETGTGKDKIAEQMHKSSPRGRKSFVKVNCGALPAALLESELFGHVKGAFTGAVSDSVGMFRLADKGTLFLTEIGDLSLPLQVKLLSVLDDHTFYPVGGSKKVKVDVRILAATHRNLRQEVGQGRFREDLFYRLNVLHLHIPSLRQRNGDIRLLLDHFLRYFTAKLPRNISGFTKKSIDILISYNYPGNVRELRNIMEYAVTVCQERNIGVEDLPQYLTLPVPPPASISAETSQSSLSVSADLEKSADTDSGGWPEVEKRKILDALSETGGSRSKAAELLGCSRTTLWRKLKKYKLT